MSSSSDRGDDGLTRRRLIRLGILLVILIGVMMSLADLATRLQERISRDDVAQQVDLLDRDPGRVNEFIKDNIKVSGYVGSLRGPVGTLWAGMGSELDRADLWMTMLQLCGEDAGLARSGQNWWVESSSVTPPSGVGPADWRGTLIPSVESFRSELEVATAAGETILSAVLDVAELADDPILFELDGGQLQLRRYSQRQPIDTCFLPKDRAGLQLRCVTLLPGELEDFAATAEIHVSDGHLSATASETAAPPSLVAVLVVVTAIPPVKTSGGNKPTTSRRFNKFVARSFGLAAASDERFKRDQPHWFESDPHGAFPRYYLASTPPLTVLPADYTATEFDIYYAPKIKALR